MEDKRSDFDLMLDAAFAACDAVNKRHDLERRYGLDKTRQHDYDIPAWDLSDRPDLLLAMEQACIYDEYMTTLSGFMDAVDKVKGKTTTA